MSGLYLIVLLVAIGCMLLVDYRWKLFFFDDVRPALATTVLLVLFFLAWDVVGIESGIFFIGDNDLMTGLEILPELPIEEPVFLVLLVQSAMNFWGAGRQLVERRESR